MDAPAAEEMRADMAPPAPQAPPRDMPEGPPPAINVPDEAKIQAAPAPAVVERKMEMEAGGEALSEVWGEAVRL